MSVNVPVPRLGWRVLPAVTAACAAMVAASFFIALSKSATTPPSPSRPPRVPETTVASAPVWKMRVFPVGTAGGLTKAQRARFESQRAEVTKIVRRVFDAWLFGRAPEATIKRHFAKAAAVEAAALDLVIERKDATIQHRRARIGIEGGVPRNAAVDVVVGGSTWVDRATLWMHRGAKGWKVIAFEIDRKARG